MFVAIELISLEDDASESVVSDFSESSDWSVLSSSGPKTEIKNVKSVIFLIKKLYNWFKF